MCAPYVRLCVRESCVGAPRTTRVRARLERDGRMRRPRRRQGPTGDGRVAVPARRARTVMEKTTTPFFSRPQEKLRGMWITTIAARRAPARVPSEWWTCFEFAFARFVPKTNSVVGLAVHGTHKIRELPPRGVFPKANRLRTAAQNQWRFGGHTAYAHLLFY